MEPQIVCNILICLESSRREKAFYLVCLNRGATYGSSGGGRATTVRKWRMRRVVATTSTALPSARSANSAISQTRLNPTEYYLQAPMGRVIAPRLTSRYSSWAVRSTRCAANIRSHNFAVRHSTWKMQQNTSLARGSINDYKISGGPQRQPLFYFN